MPTSDRQRAANLLNAQKSTGPRTADGKSRSKRNALKHGLCSEGECLPDALREEILSEVDKFNRCLKPQDHVEARCVERMALATVKIFRINAQSEAKARKRRRAALRRWDARRDAEVSKLARGLLSDPVGTVAALRLTAEGCDWLADQWDEVLAILEDGRPLLGHAADRAFLLLGTGERPTVDSHPYHAGFALELYGASEARSPRQLARYYRVLAPEQVTAELPSLESARLALAERLRGHIAELTELGERLWARQDAPDRAEAGDRVLIDTTAAGARLERYCTSASLDYQRAQKSLDAARKERRKVIEEALPPWGWDGPRNEPISDPAAEMQPMKLSAITPSASLRTTAAPTVPSTPATASPAPRPADPTTNASTSLDRTGPNPPPTHR